MNRLVLAVLLLTSCSSEDPKKALPPPAQFDATSDTRPDTRPDTSSDSADDTLLADASDAMELPDAMGDAAECVSGKTCVGAPMPTWKLEDFQPKSAGFKKVYGLDGFKGKVTVVALLSGW